MNRGQFLADQAVASFIEWLCGCVDQLEVDLSIKSSARVPGGVTACVTGVDAVLSQYKWVAEWNSPAGVIISSCWGSTVSSLGQLSQMLDSALNTPSDTAAFAACCSIFKWGGERNQAHGARPFLYSKVSASQGLCSYLNQTRADVSLASADITKLSSVQEMNSMLTKVHSLASKDGLPIYDSRVAAAIACLVEIYRHNSQLSWSEIPPLLAFPAIPEDAKKNRRNVDALQDNMPIPSPGIIRYQDSSRAIRWMSASIRLGWILGEVLSRRPDVLQQQVSRMHAFEACLFMIGYDVKCLKRNLKP